MEMKSNSAYETLLGRGYRPNTVHIEFMGSEQFQVNIGSFGILFTFCVQRISVSEIARAVLFSLFDSFQDCLKMI